jgi:hypothetical protein
MTTSSQPVHPADVIHQIEAPSEIAVPALTHHLLSVNTGQQRERQVTRLGKQEYDGVFPIGSLWLATADNTAAEWAWETTDETILFPIDPLYLQTIAAESDCLAPERLAPTSPKILGYRTWRRSLDSDSITLPQCSNRPKSFNQTFPQNRRHDSEGIPPILS